MTRREWRIAIPILAALALCVAAFLHGVQVDNSFVGFSAMRATPDGKLAVVANHALHVLDATGKRLARQPIAALSLQDDPNDLDWTVDAQGRQQAWFFDDSGPRVVRCDWDAQRAQLGGCAVAMSGAGLKSDPMSRAVHLAVDRAGERVFIADAKGAAVQVFDLAGKPLASTYPGALPLYFPNRLRYLGNDTLAIADNDHHRLVWARLEAGRPRQLLRTLEAGSHPRSRSNRTKVTDAAFGPSGATWMIAMKQGQKDGDVLVFDGERPLVRAELPAGADPIVIENLGDAAVVADYSLLTLYRLDAAGKYLGEFGDEAFTREMAPLRGLSRQSGWWTQGALAGGALVIALGFVLARRNQAPRGQGAAAFEIDADAWADDEPMRYPVVLPQTPAYRAALRKQVWQLGFVVLLMLGGFGLALFFAGTGPASRAFLSRGGPALALGIAAAAWYAREMLRPRELRVTAHRVGCFRGAERVAESPLQDVFASRKAVLIGRMQVMYRVASPGMGRMPPMFEQRLLERALLARLPRANLLDDAAMGRLVLARQPGWLKLLAGVAAAVALGWVAWQLWG